jgi:hypothetical protein
MAPTQMMIVAGAPATVADLGKDGSWLKDWLAEEPSRLGIGELRILDGEPVQDEEGNPAFLAADATRYFSVNVKLGELDASHGFHVLDSWARNRVRHPDKTHVAVLVIETLGERYETALKALSEHLPLVVVELQAWRGKTEILVVPRVALASEDLRLPKALAQRTVDLGEAARSDATNGAPRPAVGDKPDNAPKAPEAEVGDPWKLPKRDAAPAGANGAQTN